VTVGPLPPIPGSEGDAAESPAGGIAPEEAQPTMPGAIPEGLSSNARGEFAIEGVPPGRVAVHAWHPSHARGASRTLSVVDVPKFLLGFCDRISASAIGTNEIELAV
jgi:hypothetical protein